MLEIKSDAPLGKVTTFKIGGNSRAAALVGSVDELKEACAFADGAGLAFRVLGGGSNVLVGDDGFDGLIIWYRDRTFEIDASTGIIRVGGGAITAQVAGAAARAGLTGFEWAAGVPGTIGGAIYGNAGASGGEMKDVVTSVDVFERGETRTYSAAECGFAYRHSAFKNTGGIITGATLRLQHATQATDPQQKVMEVLRYRMATQPKGFASTGCIFKNFEPDETAIESLRGVGVPEMFLVARRVPAGWLIEHAGLKGLRRGAARVSEVHGNFIINEGGATAGDIIELIELVRGGVEKKFGVRLTEEITILQ